ncbi:MAG: TetR/AcrR family transcriptional regulator [Parvularcula sp.]|jgi:AcrR family transcriptional regulator|nr:TetR/AcrR family transcriptional regulator [Parvularcula sp.]
MSISTKTKGERVAAKEDAIVDAATAIFLDKGMRAAKMIDIARQADVAEGTIYLYFKNKEALFAQVVARHWADLTSGAEAAVRGENEPRDQLNALARYTFSRILEDWKLFELSFVLHYGSGEADDTSDKSGYVRVFDAVIQRGIDRGDFSPTVPPRYIRDLLFGTMEYAARSMLRKRRAGDEEAALIMLGQALDGVLATGRQDRAPPVADRLEQAVARLERLLPAEQASVGKR